MVRAFPAAGRVGFPRLREQRAAGFLSDAPRALAKVRQRFPRRQRFVLRGLDLHHPPFESLRANRMFYVIAALA